MQNKVRIEEIFELLRVMRDMLDELEKFLHELKRNDEKIDKKFYSLLEVSRILGLEKGTVWRKVRGGEIPAIRVGKKYLVPAEFFTSPGVSCSRQS